jgi:hypothetical protein
VQGVNTKVDRSSHGVFSRDGTVEYSGGSSRLKLTNSLSLKPTQSTESYEQGVKLNWNFKNSSPKSTAIHEATHAIDLKLSMSRGGHLTSDGLMKDSYLIETRPMKTLTQVAELRESKSIIEQAKKELYGENIDFEVYTKDIAHLGKYATTNNSEMMAQCVAYEYVNASASKPFSAKVLEILKKRVKEVL